MTEILKGKVEIWEERPAHFPPPLPGAQPDVIILDANTGNIVVGGHGKDGNIFIKDNDFKERIELDANSGDVTLKDRNGRVRIQLDGQNGIYGSTSTDGQAGVRGIGHGDNGQGVYGSHSGNGNGVYGETTDRNDKSGVLGVGPFRGVTGLSDRGVGVYGTTNSIENAAVQAENTGNGPALNLKNGKLTIAPGSGTSPGGKTVGSVVVGGFSLVDEIAYRSTKTITNSHATGSSLIFLTCESSSPATATVTRTAPGEFDIIVEVIDSRGRPRSLEGRATLIINSVKVNYLIVN